MIFRCTINRCAFCLLFYRRSTQWLSMAVSVPKCISKKKKIWKHFYKRLSTLSLSPQTGMNQPIMKADSCLLSLWGVFGGSGRNTGIQSFRDTSLCKQQTDEKKYFGVELPVFPYLRIIQSYQTNQPHGRWNYALGSGKSVIATPLLLYLSVYMLKLPDVNPSMFPWQPKSIGA